MANIGLLLPKYTILEYAKEVLQESGENVKVLKVIDDANAALEARKAIQEGAEVIIARGFQAYCIKKEVNVPVIDMTLTTQEIGMMILKAKKQLKKECPVIAIIGWENMFGNVDHLEELFHIRLHMYYLKGMDEPYGKVEQAIEEGADLIIGGVRVNQITFEKRFPSLFIESKQDSVREALKVAKSVANVIDLEKRNNAQLETVFDTSFNGIMKINSYREIVAVNKMMEDILGKKAKEVISFPVEKVLKGISTGEIDRLIAGEQGMYSSSILVNNQFLMLVGAPIQPDESINGAIITCHRVKGPGKTDEEQRQQLFMNGYVARHNYEDIMRTSPAMKRCIELSRAYAPSSAPILIRGEVGTEKEILAEAIHNNSVAKDGPFITFNCSAIPKEKQRRFLFGDETADKDKEDQERGAFEKGLYGTILLQEIENISLECQYLLYKAIYEKMFLYHDVWVKRRMPVRIIATTSLELLNLTEQGRFREDLYYLLSTLKLEVPSVRNEMDQMKATAKRFIQKYMEKYSRYMEITEEAYQVLEEHPWKGNMIQLEAFCEKIILLAQKKRVDAGFVRTLIYDTYPGVQVINGAERLVIYNNPEAVKIGELMEECKGNRTLVAEKMGISTTTLWRRIKKYGIAQKYGF